MCFYELPATNNSGESAEVVLETTADEIDSFAEFIAEVCLDIDNDFDDTDTDDVPDHLKKASAKHFLPHDKFSLPAAPAFAAKNFKPFRVNFTSNSKEVTGPPPEILIS